jgi:hypothetical protein
MRFIVLFFVLTSLTAFSQETSKPALSIKLLPPNAVPAGTCKEDEYGYLDTSKGDNKWVPYTPLQIGGYLADRAKQGFVVTVYPQPNGRLWVAATCHRDAN